MAGEDGSGCRSRPSVAVILVLCALARSLTCFSLQGLCKNVKQDELTNEATVMEVRTGSVLFNGKVLDLHSSSSAIGNDVLLKMDLNQSDDGGMFFFFFS